MFWNTEPVTNRLGIRTQTPTPRELGLTSRAKGRGSLQYMRYGSFWLMT